jgi:circadian clock protein KaiC
MVDGIVELLVQQVNVRTAREIVVRKLRGVHFLEGRHTLRIASEGIVIHPRVEALVARQGAGAPEIDTHQALGIPEIDRMLHGGVLTGSTTLLLGAPGTGKTSVALHFLCGAPDAQEPALFFGFYESPARLVGKAEKLGLPLKSRLASGTVELHWRLSVETRLDEIAAMILADVDRRGMRRVVIDGLGGFGEAAVYPERVLPFVTALLAALRARGVTTLATLETTAAVPGVADPQLAVSPLVENVIVLRAVEEQDRLRRMIAIRKVREGDFDASTREFEIGPSGIAVAARARVTP